MNVNKLLGTYVNNIQSIVEWLFVLVLILFIPLLYFAFKSSKKGAKSEDGAAKADLTGIEETLKRVLEATQHQPAKSVVSANEDRPADLTPKVQAGAGGAATEEMKAQVAEREKKIAELNQRIQDLQAEVAAKPASAGGGPADTAELDAKIKDLESKLKEYEIIEDDIANLSLYKEENTRLKDELNRVRSSVGGAIQEEIVTPKPEEVAQGLEMVADANSESLKDAVAKAGGDDTAQAALAASELLAGLSAELAVTPTAPAEPPPEESDLVNQLASVVQAQTPSKPTVAEAPVVAAPAAAIEPAVEAEVPEMLKGFDPDKIAEEAGKLEVKEDTGVADEPEGDVGQKLIDEFENFMKDNKT